MDLRRCNKCGGAKPTEDFYFRKDRGHLRQPCKACIAEQGREYREANPEVRRETVRRNYEKNRVQASARGRASRLKKFDMVPEEYEELLQLQSGRCAICRSEETVTDPRNGTVRSLAVDHCHETGLRRGLLCARCNMAIGMLGDDPFVLREAAHYLMGFSLAHSAWLFVQKELADAGATSEAKQPTASTE